jgi:hypothetical protein
MAKKSETSVVCYASGRATKSPGVGSAAATVAAIGSGREATCMCRVRWAWSAIQSEAH